jgi:hypothetical protein
MKSFAPGKSTSNAEVLDVSTGGLWVLAGKEEFFLPYKLFPFFRDATIGQIHRVEFTHGKYLHWPALDVDIEIDSIKTPDRYPLLYRK